MFFLPGRKIAAVIKMEALIIRERDQLEKFGSAWAVARHTIICRHTLHKTSSCEHCEPHMLTVLIFCCAAGVAAQYTITAVILAEQDLPAHKMVRMCTTMQQTRTAKAILILGPALQAQVNMGLMRVQIHLAREIRITML